MHARVQRPRALDLGAPDHRPILGTEHLHLVRICAITAESEIHDAGTRRHDSRGAGKCRVPEDRAIAGAQRGEVSG